MSKSEENKNFILKNSWKNDKWKMKEAEKWSVILD